MRRVLGIVLVAGIAGIALGWLARAPYSPAGSERGQLRLSWRVTNGVGVACRVRTPEELDALPVHMRTPEVCAAQTHVYRLVVQVDDARPDTLVVLPGGLRGDRPAFVLHAAPLVAGPHRVRVQFTATDGALDLSLDKQLHAAAGRVELFTLEETSQRLVHRTSR